MDFDPAKFGERIRAKRTDLKITQAHLAERIGTSVGYIGHLERGMRTPSLDVFVALCMELHVTPNYFLQDYIPVGPGGVEAILAPEMVEAAKQFISSYEKYTGHY